MSLDIVQEPMFEDNYLFLLIDRESSQTALVDPGDPLAALDLLASRNLELNYIINTHHHFDHVGGNKKIVEETGCSVVGPAYDEHRIPGIKIQLQDGDRFQLGNSSARVLFTPGHTLGHICYYFEDDSALFVGDTLFALGCGRLFEGTPEQMFESLAKISALPEDTKVYCAHEYTEHNACFAIGVDPTNPDLIQRKSDIRDLRSRNTPTVPTTIGLEQRTNPFLRAQSVEAFAKLRKARDVY